MNANYYNLDKYIIIEEENTLTWLLWELKGLNDGNLLNRITGRVIIDSKKEISILLPATIRTPEIFVGLFSIIQNQ